MTEAVILLQDRNIHAAVAAATDAVTVVIIMTINTNITNQTTVFLQCYVRCLGNTLINLRKYC